MHAGENLCSFKSRNNCIMRRKIYDVYRALRHFNVTAEEVNNIVEGYCHWLKDPVEKLPPFQTVYFLGNKLYSMPYPKDGLNRRLIGIEIDGVVYLVGWDSDVLQDEIEEQAQIIKADIAEKFPAINQFRLRLPTRDEAKILPEKASGIDFDSGHRYEGIYSLYSDVWITPDPDHPERTFATVEERRARPHRPSENTRATLYLVTCPDDEQIFFGEVDDYGIPTPETREAYAELKKSLNF